MADAIITLPDGRRAKLTGPTREAIMAQARKLAGQANPKPLGIDPNTGRFDPTLAIVDRMMRNPPPPPVQSTGLARLAENFNGQRPVNDALILGSIGSLAFPPLKAGQALTKIPGLAGLLSRTAQRFAPPVLASAAGGGTGAALDAAQDPNATPASIAGEAAGGAGRMAAAELAGLGLTTAAAKVFAPRLGFLDPLKGFREKFGEFVSTVPERTRNAAKRLHDMLPEGSAHNAAQSLGETAVNASRIVKELAKQNTLGKSAAAAARELGNKQATAAAVARALGENAAKRFGFSDREASAKFLFEVWRSGNQKMLQSLQKRLGSKQFEDFQMQNLSTLITRASRRGKDGELRLDGDKLKELWEALPDASRAMYSPGARRAIESLATFGSAAARIARFAATPTGSELAEAILSPLAFAAGGPALGIPVMVARQLLFPGPLTRFLTRDKLPNEIVQMLAGQGVKLPIRAGSQEQQQ